MKLKLIVRARGPLTKLLGQDIPLRTAWDLTRLVDRINVPLQFFSAELAKNSTEERMAELYEMDVELDVGARPRIDLDSPLILSATDVHALEPFVEFAEEEAE